MQKQGLSYAGVFTIFFLDTAVQGNKRNIHFEELNQDTARWLRCQ